MRTLYWLPLLSCMATCCPAVDRLNTYARPEMLVEPAELAPATRDGQFVILDARPQASYGELHVPGSRWVDQTAWAKQFADGDDAVGWSARIGELGIDTKTTVVVYDDAGMKDAARVWWILRYWGVDDVRLLNGGWKGWVAEGHPTSADPPVAVAPTSFQAQAQTARWANMQQVLELLHRDDYQIVDARSTKEHCGIDALNNQRAGSIPGATHLEWSDLMDQDTHRFKSPQELRDRFAQAGIDLDRPMTCHCQSGGRSSVMAFALELMGAREVRNYYRGWSEWGNTPDTPVVTPPSG